MGQNGRLNEWALHQPTFEKVPWHPNRTPRDDPPVVAADLGLTGNGFTAAPEYTHGPCPQLHECGPYNGSVFSSATIANGMCAEPGSVGHCEVIRRTSLDESSRRLEAR